MIAKVYRAVDVCDIAKVQPYVLRSWEKEFPGIGRQRSADGPRLYRQSDLDQVLRIKELVFTEGLTLSGARRRLEETTPGRALTPDDEVAEVLDALASDARTRIAYVKDGLRSILRMLGSAPGTVVVVDEPGPRAQTKRPAARARSGRKPPIASKRSRGRKAAPAGRKGATLRKRSSKQRRGRAHA
jgi:DNA-binding transcriptional MerR regulator